MEEVELRDVVEVSRGAWIARGGPPDGTIVGLSTDSRTVRSGEVFVALEGERFDGHRYVDEALRRGARAAVVRRGRTVNASGPLIAVADPLEALELVAAWYRSSLSVEVTAITGSFGKTTTKEFLRAILERKFRVKAAPSSFNNRLGVALTLLGAERATQHLVAEFGTSAPGEIAHLSRLVRPERVVITAIGLAHLTGLQNLEGVLAAKAEILEGLRDDGTAYVNRGIEGFDTIAGQVRGRLVTFGWNDGDFPLTDCRRPRSDGGVTVVEFRVGGELFCARILGRHNLLNAAAAVTVARDLGLDWDEIRAGLEDCRLPSGRLELHYSGGVLLIDDAYNANPGSMRAAIETWSEIGTGVEGRRVAVLGDMLEMGESSASVHEEVGRQLASCTVDMLVTIGTEAEHLVRAFVDERQRTAGGSLPEMAHFATADDAERFLEGRLSGGDCVLFKASNRMGLHALATRVRRHLREKVELAASTFGHSA